MNATNNIKPSIRRKMILSSSPEKVFGLISTDEGRELFWSKTSTPTGGGFRLTFTNGAEVECRVLKVEAPSRFVFEYFGASRVEFTITPAADGGCEFCVVEPACPGDEWLENYAGWISWLFCLKGAADFGIDLRNNDPNHPWGEGFADG